MINRDNKSRKKRDMLLYPPRHERIKFKIYYFLFVLTNEVERFADIFQNQGSS